MAVVVPLVKSSQIALVSVAIVFGCIGTVAVILRLVAIRISRRRFDASDYGILVAWLLMIGLMVMCVLEAVLGGFGWHREEIEARFGPDPNTQYHKILLPLEMLWTLSLTASKISVLSFYTKVFASTNIRVPARVTMVIVALMGTSGVLCTLLICQPIAYNWDLQLPGGHCGSQSAVFAVFAFMNLVTDVVVLAMPISSLLTLRLSLWKKASLLATFTVGFITCIVSIVRVVYLSKIDYTDVTYTSVTAVLMTAVEPSLAVTLACVPLLRPLLGRLGGSDSGATRGSLLRSSKKPGGTTWMSTRTGWGKSKALNSTLTLSNRRSTLQTQASGTPRLIRLGSVEVDLDDLEQEMKISNSRGSRHLDEGVGDQMALRYVLQPGEGVSHHTHVEAFPRRGNGSTSGSQEEMARQQLEEDLEAGRPTGPIEIVVTQEWNVESEPRTLDHIYMG